MTFRTVVTLFLAASLLLLSQDGPESALRQNKRFAKSTLISGLDNPWEITWGPDNFLWVTERSGKRISRVDPRSGKKQVAITIDEVSAPGGQDGLLGLALHPEFLKGSDFVYTMYTYVDRAKGPHKDVANETSPYRYLYAKIVRLRYDAASGTLSEPTVLISGLPAGNDHLGGRVKIGPDRKIYFTIGDGGHNQLGNFCLPIEAQRLPVAAEVQAKNYEAYRGKSMRMNLDGSVPADNPKLNGVVSHVFTYGHRNTQGIDFGPNGLLYGAEHGPKTDDEVNVMVKGGNYGWPHVAGLRDDKAYVYARWAESTTPCSELKFSDTAEIPASVPRTKETDYKQRFVEPIATLFTVPSTHNFEDPACKGVHFICWPTVGISGIEYYGNRKGVPGWEGGVLLVTSLKRGSLYIVPLAPGGRKTSGKISRYFQTENRYRDTAVSPDGKTIYLATDSSGLAESGSGGVTFKMADGGSILAFTYEGEGAPVTEAPKQQREATTSQVTSVGGAAPQFTADQAAAGKTIYNASCAVCHGNTLANGTMGTPLAGEYFQKTWGGRPVAAFFKKSKTMPPAAPASLPDESYVNVVAYILQSNGFQPGASKLAPGSDAFDRMTLHK